MRARAPRASGANFESGDSPFARTVLLRRPEGRQGKGRCACSSCLDGACPGRGPGAAQRCGAVRGGTVASGAGSGPLCGARLDRTGQAGLPQRGRQAGSLPDGHGRQWGDLSRPSLCRLPPSDGKPNRASRSPLSQLLCQTGFSYKKHAAGVGARPLCRQGGAPHLGARRQPFRPRPPEWRDCSEETHVKTTMLPWRGRRPRVQRRLAEAPFGMWYPHPCLAAGRARA